MFSFYNGYTPVNESRLTLFAGANTESSFKSSYPTIANERNLERVYVIKGGSGSGKSTLMKKAAAAAEKKGHTCAYYLCGSDPYSLDAVVIDNRIAILDGTAPHVRDMTYPGAASTLVDVSKFWNPAILEEKREEIVSLLDEKSAAYTGAYEFLRCAGSVCRSLLHLSETCFLREKAAGFITRFISRLPKPAEPTPTRTDYYSHGITMRGLYRTDPAPAETTFAVEDYACTAPHFLAQLAKALTDSGYSIITTTLPIAGIITSIQIPEAKVTVTTSAPRESDARIAMPRFTSRENYTKNRGQMKLEGAIYDSAISEACTYLARAAETHFAVEEIYKSAMDFDSLEKYGNTVRDDILTRLKK